MINNDILRRITTILDFDDAKICSVFKLNSCDITTEQLICFFKEKNDADYVELLDVELASFLNGLIVEKRGAKEGPAAVAETASSFYRPLPSTDRSASCRQEPTASSCRS